MSVWISVRRGLIVKFPESGVRIRREINVLVVASRGATDPDLGFVGVSTRNYSPANHDLYKVGGQSRNSP